MDDRARAEAVDLAWHGDLGPARALAIELARSDPPAARAWSLLVSAHEHHAGVTRECPALTSIAALREASPEARGIAGLALALIARGSLLSFDRAGLDAARSLLELLERESGSVHAALWLEVTRLWCEVLSGAGQELEPRLEALRTSASRERLAELVIEANVLRAAALLNAGDLEGATQLARRVSRMARAEAMPHEEYLAHFVLARVRRLGDHAHLASRILGSLWKAAPPPWRAWLGWELRLTGDVVPADGDPGPGALASELIAAFVSGDPGAIEQRTTALRASLAGFGAAAREAECLIAAIDPRVPVETLGKDLLPWATGQSTSLPFGLHSVVSNVESPHAELAGHSWVLVSPGASSRRFLHPGIGVMRGAPVLEQTARRHGRTETATAVLALAGPRGMPLRKFVSEVYGFAYSHDAHDGVLRVLLHRMRKSLEAVATIDRSEDLIVLRALCPFLVPDPRTSVPSSDRVLRMIAIQPGASAKEMATALGMPLRTVQAVLTQLVADGSCMADRAQGGVEYRLEDTTFSEPTRTESGTMEGA